MGNSIRALLVAVLTALVMVAGTSYAEEVPLPSDLKIVPPDPSVPPELAKFSGKWGDGNDKWDGQLAHILVVEKVDAKGAQVIYAYGTASQWWITAPGWERMRGKFNEKGELVVTGKRGEATYRLSGDKLEGSYRGRACCYKITLSRVE